MPGTGTKTGGVVALVGVVALAVVFSQGKAPVGPSSGPPDPPYNIKVEVGYVFRGNLDPPRLVVQSLNINGKDFKKSYVKVSAADEIASGERTWVHVSGPYDRPPTVSAGIIVKQPEGQERPTFCRFFFVVNGVDVPMPPQARVNQAKCGFPAP